MVFVPNDFRRIVEKILGTQRNRNPLATSLVHRFGRTVEVTGLTPEELESFVSALDCRGIYYILGE